VSIANQPNLSALFAQRFESAEIIGYGGMATVYRAFDTVSQRDVALKVLHAHLREHAIIAGHFRQEYAIAQVLEHPNIVRIHSIIDTPQMLALVMELHGHYDLKKYLQNHGKMEPRVAVEVGTQMLSALEAAHAQNIVHQDIKPHNILWDIATDTAKLIDFGLAQRDESIAFARPESAMATVEYSAPEQFDDFGTDARADLYSLGITLFELLSNTLPYRGDSAASIIQMHRDAPIPDVRVFARAVPEHVALALMRAMAKAPEDRFDNAAQMRDALCATSQVATPTLPAASAEWETLKSYPLDIAPPNPARLASWRRLQRWRKLPRRLNTISLFLLFAASATALYFAGAYHLPALTVATLGAWLLVFARASFSFSLDRFAPPEDALDPALLDATHNQRQSDAPDQPPQIAGFLQKTHAMTYHALRSRRIQTSFERILLTLLQIHDAHPEKQAHTRDILAKTTAIAARIAQLEKKIASQNYPAIFEQLARMDTQIARAEDTEETAEWIAQKSLLRAQLDQIDRDRQALKTLGGELSGIAAQLKR